MPGPRNQHQAYMHAGYAHSLHDYRDTLLWVMVRRVTDSKARCGFEQRGNAQQRQ